MPILESNSSRVLFNVNDASTTVEAGWKNSSPFAPVNKIPVTRPSLCTMRRTQLPVRNSKFLCRASTGIKTLLGCALAPTMQPYRWQCPQYFARAAHNAVRILVWFAQVRRGRGIGMIAQPAHGRFKHVARVGVLERRRGILLLARPFKDVAAIDFSAAQIAGFPADAHQLLGFPVGRFEIVVGDRPILNREVLGQLGRSVFLK